MGKAADFYNGLNEAIKNAIDRVSPFRATAHAVVDGKVQIQQIGSDAPLDEPFARLEGLGISAGDEVAVVMMNGQPFVLGKVQRTAGGTAIVDKPLLITVENNDAFRVQKPSGVGIFEVDSQSPSQVRVLNDVHLAGYTNEGSGDPIWNIDGSSGAARFDGGIEAGSFNSPKFYSREDTQGAVSSTTNTATYVEVRTLSFTLPEGTWSLFIIGSAQFSHSAGGWVDYGYDVNGIAYGHKNVDADANSWSTVNPTVVAHGFSGAVNVKMKYKSYSVGTSNVDNNMISVIAYRTS